MIQKYLAHIRDTLFVISLLTTAVFFVSPDARRQIEKLTTRTIAVHLGTYSSEKMNWVSCFEGKNPNFYHVTLHGQRKLHAQTIEALEGKIVIGEPKGTVPGREWPEKERNFSGQDVVSNVSGGTCYFVEKVKPVPIETTENSSCPAFGAGRISYWLKAVRVTCG